MNCRTKSTATSRFPHIPLFPVAGAPISTAVAYVIAWIIPDYISAGTLHPSPRNPNPIALTPAIVPIHPHRIRIGYWSDRSPFILDTWNIAVNQVLARLIDGRRIDGVEQRLSDRVGRQDTAILVNNTSGDTQSNQHCGKHFAHSLTSFRLSIARGVCAVKSPPRPTAGCLQALNSAQGHSRLQRRKSAFRFTL